MKLSRISLILVALIPVTGFLFLPSEAASHFDIYGKADDFMPRAALILIFTLSSSLFAFGIPFFSRILPARTDSRVRLGLNIFGKCWALWFFLFFLCIIAAHRSENPVLSITAVAWITPVLFLPLTVLILPQKHAG